ncbi:hypothetical protein NX059_003001 [Plenodomus lindquistii]|nr:hypothetical protein NX059_003001 [Plenodomus lindquistii]
MNRNTKISVIGVLGLGIFASVSGLVRMKYTIALTSRNDYAYGLANLLIWGYAEPALGMTVGNIATLRPLFQRVLSLGSGGSGPGKSNRTTAITSTPGRTHPYKPFDPDHELGVLDNNKGDHVSTHIHAGQIGRDSVSSDNESQKEILEKSAMPPKRGIVVSQQVEISHS